MVNRQNKSASSSTELYQRDAGACWGCLSQVSASQTLMSIKYEVVGRLRVGTKRSRPTLPLEQRQRNALALTRGAHRGDTGNGPAVFGDDDPFLGEILQQRETLSAELGNAEVSHT